jgi:hypothetical protein
MEDLVRDLVADAPPVGAVRAEEDPRRKVGRGGAVLRHVTPLEHRQHACELLAELVRITRVCSARNASTSSSSLLLT